MSRAVTGTGSPSPNPRTEQGAAHTAAPRPLPRYAAILIHCHRRHWSCCFHCSIVTSRISGPVVDAERPLALSTLSTRRPPPGRNSPNLGCRKGRHLPVWCFVAYGRPTTHNTTITTTRYYFTQLTPVALALYVMICTDRLVWSLRSGLGLGDCMTVVVKWQ